MAAMKPRTGDGPMEVTKEGRGVVMRVPLEGGGRLVVEMTVEEAKELAQLCALNALAALNLVADVDDVARIVRVVGYVNGAPGFINHPAVVNGASELLIALWGDENGKHARSAIGVAELPLNSPVEVELTFELK